MLPRKRKLKETCYWETWVKVCLFVLVLLMEQSVYQLCSGCAMLIKLLTILLKDFTSSSQHFTAVWYKFTILILNIEFNLINFWVLSESWKPRRVSVLSRKQFASRTNHLSSHEGRLHWWFGC